MSGANGKLKFSLNPNAKSVEAYWYPNGTSAITSIQGNGVHGVTRSGTGAYTVTFTHPWRHIVHANCDLVSAAGTTTLQVTGCVDGVRGNSGSAYFTLENRLVGSATTADIAAGTGTYVQMTCTLCDSRVIESTY